MWEYEHSLFKHQYKFNTMVKLIVPSYVFNACNVNHRFCSCENDDTKRCLIEKPLNVCFLNARIFFRCIFCKKTIASSLCHSALKDKINSYGTSEMKETHKSVTFYIKIQTLSYNNILLAIVYKRLSWLKGITYFISTCIILSYVLNILTCCLIKIEEHTFCYLL